MLQDESKLPYICPVITVFRVELEHFIAASVSPDSSTGSEVSDDYADGGGEWTSGEISF